MKALLPDRDYSHYLTIYGCFRLFPIKKKKNGEYLCDLVHNSQGKEEHIEWSIPAEYIEDEGYVTYNQNDIYFGRWLIKEKYITEKDENGKEQTKRIYVLTRLIAFWNTRFFNYDTKAF